MCLLKKILWGICKYIQIPGFCTSPTESDSPGKVFYSLYMEHESPSDSYEQTGLRSPGLNKPQVSSFSVMFLIPGFTESSRGSLQIPFIAWTPFVETGICVMVHSKCIQSWGPLFVAYRWRSQAYLGKFAPSEIYGSTLNPKLPQGCECRKILVVLWYLRYTWFLFFNLLREISSTLGTGL